MRPGQYADKKRNLRKLMSKSITAFPSRKLNQSILTESPLEADFCYHLDLSPEVLSYEPQPLGFYYEFEGKVCLYTPDFLVTTKQAKEYFEIKYDQDIHRDPKFSERFACQQQQAEELGTSLTLITDKEIYSSPSFNNNLTLFQYLWVKVSY